MEDPLACPSRLAGGRRLGLNNFRKPPGVRVRNLTRDPVGNWAAEAERGGVEIAVVLQVNGEIAEE